MKITCKIIEDLLPLYRDQVCSRESCELVEEHLKDCSACSAVLDEINREIQCPKMAEEETKRLKGLRIAWDKGKRKAFLKGTALAVLICAVLAGLFLGLTQWKCIPVSADVLEVSEVCRLSDGRLGYHLKVKDDKALYFVKFTAKEDGSYYMTPMRSVIERKAQSDLGLHSRYYTVDIDAINSWQKRQGEKEITSCYVGPEKDGILIWKEGAKIPPASEELEMQIEDN